MPAKKSPITIAFGTALRTIRREKGFSSHEAFAERAGLDRSYVGAIERGEFNVTLDTMVKLATGLDTKVSVLLARAKL